MSYPKPLLDSPLAPAESRPIDRALPSEGAAAPPSWFEWIAWIGFFAYAVFLASHMTVVAGGSDSSGYLNSARLFAAGEWETTLRVPAEFGAPAEINRSHFSPQGFNLFDDSFRLSPTYPTGLPLHFALAGRLFGWRVGPFLVQLAAALAAVWLCYRTARELGLGYALAGAGAFVLGAFPVFVFTSIQTLSDTLATTWTLATLLCAIRARRSDVWATACGAAFAVAVLVRPTNLLIAPGVVVLLGFDLRRLVLFVSGGLPGAAWLAMYNHALYGGAFRSGYGDIFATFGLVWGVPTAVHFVKWLALLMPAVLLIAPFVALFRRGSRTRDLMGLLLVVAANIGLYLFYDVSHDTWWCLRFILPGIAALILAALLGFDALARTGGARWRRWFPSIAAVVLVLWAAAGARHWVRHLSILYVPGYERAYESAARLVQERVPGNAIVVCSVFSGTLYYYTALPSLVYDHMTPEEFARYAELARRGGRPIFAVIFDIEEEDVLRKRCPGNWSRIASVEKIGIWRLER